MAAVDPMGMKVRQSFFTAPGDGVMLNNTGVKESFCQNYVSTKRSKGRVAEHISVIWNAICTDI